MDKICQNCPMSYPVGIHTYYCHIHESHKEDTAPICDAMKNILERLRDNPCLFDKLMRGEDV